MRILVTGGAGYVGSHTASLLCKEGYEIIILDDLSTGHKWALKGEEFIEGSLLDESLLNNVFKERNINKVMHFAAKSIVSESEENPTLYFQNNVSGSINLFKAMLKHKVNDIVFSSSAAVYGEPVNQEISEDQTKRPINIYGKTKLIIENLLMDLYKKEGLNLLCTPGNDVESTTALAGSGANLIIFTTGLYWDVYLSSIWFEMRSIIIVTQL